MFRSLRRLPKEFWAAIAVSAVVLGGCAALQAPEPVIPATPNDPSWRARDIQDHLTYLNGSATVGRTIGSAAMESAAQYAASRMQDRKSTRRTPVTWPSRMPSSACKKKRFQWGSQ